MDHDTARGVLESWSLKNLQFMYDGNHDSYGTNIEWMRLILAVARGEGYTPLGEGIETDEP